MASKSHTAWPGDLVGSIMSAQEARVPEIRRRREAARAAAEMQAQAEQARKDILAAQDEAGRLDATINESARTGAEPDAKTIAEREAIGHMLSEDDAARAVARQAQEPSPAAQEDGQAVLPGDSGNESGQTPNVPQKAARVIPAQRPATRRISPGNMAYRPPRSFWTQSGCIRRLQGKGKLPWGLIARVLLQVSPQG